MVCLPVSAHHGNAAYWDKMTEFKNATVTKCALANPHCIVEFDAKDDSGKVVNWTAETGSPEALRLLGWNKNLLKPGDMITIYLHAAKTGAPAGRFTKVVLADGTVLGDTQGKPGRDQRRLRPWRRRRQQILKVKRTILAARRLVRLTIGSWPSRCRAARIHSHAQSFWFIGC